MSATKEGVQMCTNEVKNGSQEKSKKSLKDQMKSKLCAPIFKFSKWSQQTFKMKSNVKAKSTMGSKWSKSIASKQIEVKSSQKWQQIPFFL